MSTLYLVRHAQASFLSDDYDQLSELGFEQSKKLGEHWGRHGLIFDRVFVGPCRRHRQTLEGIVAGFDQAGIELAPSIELTELDEYPADRVVVALLPRLIARLDLAGLAQEAQESDDLRARGRALDKLLQHALRAWAEDGIEASGAHEPWTEFVARVERAFSRLTAVEGSGKHVLAVSSAGTIGAMVGNVLGAVPGVMLELGWAINNAAVTEIAFSGARANLFRFNVLAHLNEPSSWTRR